jgi:hypothetical protein
MLMAAAMALVAIAAALGASLRVIRVPARVAAVGYVRVVDEQTESWGIKGTTVEIKDVEIPEAMQRAMARQAEAERERRAKIIGASLKAP